MTNTNARAISTRRRGAVSARWRSRLGIDIDEPVMPGLIMAASTAVSGIDVVSVHSNRVSSKTLMAWIPQNLSNAPITNSFWQPLLLRMLDVIQGYAAQPMPTTSVGMPPQNKASNFKAGKIYQQW